MPDPSLEEQIQSVREAVAELSDGKWDKGDAKAIVVLAGALAAFLALGLEAAHMAGLFADDPVEASTDGG